MEHLKRYTTLGMATDQGKIGNIIGLAIMASELNRNIEEVGTSKFRPPYTPIAIGALASNHKGKNFRLVRRTPLHEWNESKGCVMTETGLWKRSWYFPKEKQSIEEACSREVEITRNNVGICDVSSLGRIMIQGPDALKFLNMIYINSFDKLSIGKARYGIMLRDDGFVLDDGTVWRLSENYYLITTTTRQASFVMTRLEELLQIRWPELKVHLTSVTDQWAGCAIAGPKSREILEMLILNKQEVSDKNLSFMGVKKIKIHNIECYVARISFSGELAFEIYIPSDYANHLMNKIWQKVIKIKGCIYGSEALGTMRIEKGHISTPELDGRVTVDDLGLGDMVSKKKAFVGSSLRLRDGLSKPERPQLVGIYPEDKKFKFRSGGLLYPSKNITGHPLGWVTSSSYSPTLGHYIGLGFIKGGLRKNHSLNITLLDTLRSINMRVKIVSPQMYDPERKKLYG